MKNANELRIGNWVQCDIWDNGNIKKLMIKAVSPFGIHVYGHEGNFSSLDPIPLSPEILVACGFEHNQNIDVYDKDDFAGYFDIEKDLKLVVEQGYGEFYPPCEYLHQLQNLFFALTGKELEYKPNT